jgi:hypothetical protein
VAKTYRIYNSTTNEFLLGPRNDLTEAKRDVENLCELGGVSGRIEVREFDEGEEPPHALGRIVYEGDA